MKIITNHEICNVLIQYQTMIKCNICLFVHLYLDRSLHHLHHHWIWTSPWPFYLEYMALSYKSVEYSDCCKIENGVKKGVGLVWVGLVWFVGFFLSWLDFWGFFWCLFLILFIWIFTVWEISECVIWHGKNHYRIFYSE